MFTHIIRTFVLLSALAAAGCTWHHEGTITAKHYVPTSVGTGISGKGEVTVTTVPDRFCIELDNGADEVCLPQEDYTRLRVGMRIAIDEHILSNDIKVIR